MQILSRVTQPRQRSMLRQGGFECLIQRLRSSRMRIGTAIRNQVHCFSPVRSAGRWRHQYSRSILRDRHAPNRNRSHRNHVQRSHSMVDRRILLRHDHQRRYTGHSRCYPLRPLLSGGRTVWTKEIFLAVVSLGPTIYSTDVVVTIFCIKAITW